MKALIVQHPIYILNTGLTAIVMAKRRITLGIRGFGILAVILIIISSYALFFYFQNQSLQQVKSQLFEEQKQRQLGSTQQIAGFMGSDLTIILSYLDGISNSKCLQDGEFDGQDVAVVGAGNSSSGSSTIAPVGNDLSFRPWVRETRDTLKPVFSQGFEHLG